MPVCESFLKFFELLMDYLSAPILKRPSVAFVTTCKGRLHHIKQTLPLIIAQHPDEIVVVDYGCPDRVGDWVKAHFPDVKVVRVEGDTGFCLAKARNVGAMNTRATWLCFIDADVEIAPRWIEWLRQNLEDGFFISEHILKAGM